MGVLSKNSPTLLMVSVNLLNRDAALKWKRLQPYRTWTATEFMFLFTYKTWVLSVSW